MYYKLIRESQDGKAVRGHIYSVEHRFSRSVSINKEYLTKVTQDQIDFLAQKDLANGKKTMNAYLWLVCGREYDESQD